MNDDQFGYLLEQVLRDLPPKAEPFVKGVAFVVEDRPTSGPPRLADWTRDRTAAKQYAEYWAMYQDSTTTEPQGRITLYRESILEAGTDATAMIREAVLRAIEAKLGVNPGALERDVATDEPGWKPDDEEGTDNSVPDPPEPADSLVELAECELEVLPVAARDWFDDIEIAAVAQPEAEGDPARLADYPEPDDDPKALVLYSKNILALPDPPAETVREILREAARRAGVTT
ncbi:MAG: hypothetical protein K8T20_08750 [Planctomycetes bacterium]|nr:hypothetical protein [Planctomycetota bacterium]